MNETLEEAAMKFANDNSKLYESSNHGSMYFGFYWGAQWQQEQSYTEQEVLHLLDTLWDRLDLWYNRGIEDDETEFNLKEWFDECELKKK
jgi:hypothetical protein